MTSIKKAFAFGGMAVALGLVAACSDGSNNVMQGGQGAVQFVMGAAAEDSARLAATSPGELSPDQQLQAANVTFASILARNLDGVLTNVTIALPTTVDLIGLGSEGTFTLPAGFLPPGEYDQIIIVITSVALTLGDGTIVTIEPPGGGWTSVLQVADPFTVVDGQTTTVEIVFRRGRLFQLLNGRWEFNPDFECSGHHGGHDTNHDTHNGN
jgi:hypothetical protein